MELEKFLLLLVQKGREISDRPIFWINGENYIKVPVRFTRLIADSTKNIKFGCDFDESGLCFSWRKRIESKQCTVSNPTGSSRCCCVGCSDSIGYLRHFNYEDLPLYADLYNTKNGFWQPGIGCTLPRSLRSSTCVGYHCAKYNDKGEIIQFPRRDEIIFYLLSFIGYAYNNYMEWNNWTKAWKVHPRAAFLTEESFSKFVDEWVKRSPHTTPILGKMEESWREYYAKNPYVSESKAV